MSHALRFRSGQVQLRRFRVDAADLIRPGDLIVLDGDTARPASSTPDAGSPAATREAASESFAGVAHTGSPVGDATPVSVDVSATSVYEVAVREAAYEVGDLLGPDEAAGALSSDRLDAVASPSEAVARAAEFTDGPVGRLRVTFASAVNTASANASAQIG